ncbi:MAG TPA: energy transducer TonB [Thermoanaerobaculia bacterium]|nr:energy transducer TonB [Thermoanaerobaculia bacterium]
MFESVVPESFGKRSRLVCYEAGPVSLAIHLVLIGGAVVCSVWDVAFPQHSPAQMMSFTLAELPPPPPPPPAPPKAVESRLPVVRVIEMPDEIVAPTMIPESIPDLRPESLIAAPIDASPEGVEGGIEGGMLGGIFGGVTGGEVGGTIGGTHGGVIADTNQVTVERDRPLPMYPLSQVYPSYPEEARLRAWEDELIVRYVVGTNGRVREVTVISPPERSIFVDATVRAISNWRFRPLIEDGERKEVVHELTVFYRITHT